MDLSTQLDSFYKGMHPSASFLGHGRIPSTEEFSEYMDKIDHNLEYKIKNNYLSKTFFLTYLEGYSEGIIDALETIGWNNHLIHKFVAIYIDVKYLNKYAHDSSWYDTLSKQLNDFYDIAFVHQIMDKHFSGSSLLEITSLLLGIR